VKISGIFFLLSSSWVGFLSFFLFLNSISFLVECRLKLNLKDFEKFCSFSKDFVPQKCQHKRCDYIRPPWPLPWHLSGTNTPIPVPRCAEIVTASPNKGPHHATAKTRDHLMRDWPNESPAWG
jgi:hypothetical protein